MNNHIVRLALLLVLLLGCKKNDSQPELELFNPEYKDLQLKSGFKNDGITIKAADWSVEYVKDGLSGQMFLDKAGQPILLKTVGAVEIQNGWLKLEKTLANEQLILSLKENLSSKPRKIVIGILADGKRDQLSFTQTRGEGYAIVQKEITEIPGSRKEHTTNEGLHAITINNNAWVAKYIDITGIYKDVKYMSEFISHDVDAFNWVNTQDTLVAMDEILKDGAIYWSAKVPYKKGQSFQPYVTEEGSKIEILVKANTNVKVRGKIVYLSRECLYTFTIKNLSSGNTFEVSGIWKQKVPISTSTEIYE
jgi:hypothetical protein